MIGIELVEDPETRAPANALASATAQACLDRGLLIITAGTFGNVLRVLVPLVIPDDQLAHGLDILEDELLARAKTDDRRNRRSLAST
jgi:4-aminobutyrate aminotransferase / (S)-3-amino-2-methylpropionate transaminase / 5-aminovalerate transaminase